MDSAKVAFCENDTLKTITILETIEKTYTTDALIVFTNKALADLYLIRGKIVCAKEKILYALTYKPTNRAGFKPIDTCNKILSVHNFLRTKADLCVAISQLYLNEKQFDSTIYYLNLADNRLLPYGDCANGMIMYKSLLSPFFADYYLAVGDTTKAIARLLDFFMQHDGNWKLLTQKLKSILLLKFTQKEITKQVDKGLRELKFIKIDNYNFDVSLTLFGHNVKDYCFVTPQLVKKAYKKDPSLKILRDN